MICSDFSNRFDMTRWAVMCAMFAKGHYLKILLDGLLLLKHSFLKITVLEN